MERETVRDQVRRIAEEARAASGALAQTSADERNGALASMAAALRSHAAAIVEANGCDMDAARKAGTKEGLLDRLMLDEDRVEAMAAALEDLVALPDPLGAVQQKRTLESGIELQRVSVPLGVVAVVYEARPNVTADAAGICLKSGNAAVLRGGSMAAASNEVIARVLHEAAVEAGMPRGCIGAVTLADRAAADELMQLHGVVDVLIPRGGAGLIRHCVETSKVPVIETGTGNCHVYVHESADYDKARAIIVNAKCRRLGVCNAAETLLVDEAAAEGFLPAALAERFYAQLGFYACTVSNLEQYTLANFIAQGHLEKHINRMRNRYKQKKDRILAEMERCGLFRVAETEGAESGLHFLLHVHTGESPQAIERRARENGLRVTCLSDYCHATPANPEPALVIGYSSIPDARIPEAVRRLARAVLGENAP